MTRLVLLATSPRVAAGLLSPTAWQTLQSGPVYAADPGAPLAAVLVAGGLEVRALARPGSPEQAARELLSAADEAGAATFLIGPDPGRPPTGEIVAAVLDLCTARPDLSVERIEGNGELPGARLLDVVATMDRLRSPGGCPWDAGQDHHSLAPYLLEEAYEAFQAIEDDDSAALRDELGDVLLQVAFHARMAEELPPDQRWSIDDVASGLVDKLVRRHPHVFADTEVDGAEAVSANWETIKAAERGGASALASVPLAAPALTLAATLQRKAARAGLASSTPAAGALASAAERFERAPSAESAGDLLWAAVEAMRAVEIDPEAALRARARAFRDQAVADGVG